MENVEEFAMRLDEEVLKIHFGTLRRTVLKNMVLSTVGLVLVLRMVKGWYGRLTLSGIGRCMPSEGTCKSRCKRLDRFLDNANLIEIEVTKGLVGWAMRLCGEGLVPVLMDQVTVGDVECIEAVYPWQGRGIPLGITTFEKDNIKGSQNTIEMEFLRKLHEAFKGRGKPVTIKDRGYARWALLRECRLKSWLYIVRGRMNMIVQYWKDGKFWRTSLGRLPHKQGKPGRYCNVLLGGKDGERVDVIVYREREFKETWFLIVPANSEQTLPTEMVVEWYRSRMRIEVRFRDMKSLLGVRGLKLQVRKAERLYRLLVCLAIVYILMIELGDSDVGRQLRSEIEVLRLRSRHGTRRTLSVLSMALMVASDSFDLLTAGSLMAKLSSIIVAMDAGSARWH